MDILDQIRKAVGVDKLMDNVNRVNQVAKTIENLSSLLTDNKVSNSAKELIKGLIFLVKKRPNITSINHYFNHLLLQLDPENQPPILKDLLVVYQERWRNVEYKSAEQAFEFIDFKEETALLLHDTDKSVIALLNLLSVKNKKIKVYQTLSRPDGSGKEQAEAVSKMNFPVRLVDDNAIAQVLPDIDYVIMGSEIIMHKEFVNKVGTHTVIAAAKYYKRLIFVVSDSRKLLNKKHFPKNVVKTLIGNAKESNNELWRKAPKQIDIENYRKEQIPSYLVNYFILEDGVYTPAEIKKKVDKVMVNRFL